MSGRRSGTDAGWPLFVQRSFCCFKVRSVTVEGSSRYTKDEISSMVMTGPLGDNSVLLSLRYRDKPIRNIPFIETMKVQVVAHDSIRIRVYEKTIAGYVDYLGTCMYFDRDGIVVESSKEKLKDVPEVTGLKFQSIVLYKKLPAENDAVFDRILTVTQLLSKYGLHADRIYFSTTSRKINIQTRKSRIFERYFRL